MKSFCFTIAVVFFAHALSINAAAAANDGSRKKVKIGLLTAGLPWAFGPYQTQMHELSLLLSNFRENDEIEYDVHWLHYADPEVPKGLYKNYEAFKHHIPTTVPPSSDFPLDHLTFRGKVFDGQMSASKFNRIQKENDLDCIVTLMDITKVVPDAAFNFPVLAWIPLHSETVSSSSVDYWVLRMYHGIAGLAPSSAKAIEDALGKDVELPGELQMNPDLSKSLKNMFGSVQVDFIPHIFDQKAILDSADVGLDVLKDHSVAEADAKLTDSPLINRGQELTLEAGHSRSLFGEERKDDFIILLQGGNYEAEDRKGWDTSLQAFKHFYNSLDDPSGVHLLIHSMESYLIPQDNHMNADAPASVMPMGIKLHYLLHEHGLPRDSYTIDIAKHAPEVVAAYKKRADVCLHPSKVEGFGMNVMECQVVGTPVITTNYTAMGDFTKIGRSVPHRQTIRSPSTIYTMAMPDVIGVADALRELHEDHLAIKRGEKEVVARRENDKIRFNDWLDKTCSPDAVGDKFKALIPRAISEFENRAMGKKALFSSKPPQSGAYEIATGYHSTIVDWDAPWTLFAPDGLKITNPGQLHTQAWMLLLDTKNQQSNVFVLPATYEDGTNVPPFNDQNDINDDLPILVRSWLVTALQGTTSRRKSILMQAISQSSSVQQLNVNPVIVERKKNHGTFSSHYQDSEL